MSSFERCVGALMPVLVCLPAFTKVEAIAPGLEVATVKSALPPVTFTSYGQETRRIPYRPAGIWTQLILRPVWVAKTW
jgi:hypothetical protein